jgi:hypothetical protein
MSGLSTNVVAASLCEVCAPSTGPRLQTQLNVEFPRIMRSRPVLRVVVVSDTGALLS